jgi:hypothetical protein
VGDDKTDNTEAFSACLKAVVAAGGGRMVLPDGVYRGQITIPPVSKPLPSWITIEIMGESEPATVWGTVGSFPLQQNGTIIKSLATPGAAVISASPSPNSVFGAFSAVHVVLRNLDVRTCDNPDRDGIDLRHALQCKLENVFINKEIHIAGQSDSGVVAGVGRLMREMRYQNGRVEVPFLHIAETPQMPNRGMYLWARKDYFGKPDQVDRYVEEFALWGCNGIGLWFEMGMFKSFDDPEAKKWLAIYQRLYATAKRMGMKTGLLMVMNDAYNTSPTEMRIKPIIGCPNHYLCPNKPGSVEQMIAWQEQVFKALPQIDIFNLFPADPGGCSCPDCTPWPTRGFWRIAKPLADRIHTISPMTEIWVDTWHVNHPTFGGKDWQNLVANLDWTKQRPEWFAGFEVGLAPHHGFARMSAEDRKVYNEAKQPLMVFPDISMWGNHPGMLVNKEYWKSLQTEMNDYSPGLMKGGWPYSERWNTDIASVMLLSWFWTPKKSVDSVMDDYASFYFGSEAAAGRELLDLLDDANKDPQRKEKIREKLAKLDGSLPEWVKRDWRWAEIVASCRFRTR